MKKILLLVCLLIQISTYAQNVPKESYASFSLRTDIKSALLGSPPTNNRPALDLIGSLHMVGDNLELNVGDELFNQIGFNRFFVNFGYHSQRYIPFNREEYDFTVIPYVGASTILRYGKPDRTLSNGDFIYGTSSHLAVQAGLSFRAKLSDKILIDFTTEGLTRQDLNYLYPTDPHKFIVISNSIGIHYIITD